MALSTDMLEAFVKVAERLSVSAAAADLDPGQAVVSKPVSPPEAWMTGPVVTRNNPQNRPTPSGGAPPLPL